MIRQFVFGILLVAFAGNLEATAQPLKNFSPFRRRNVQQNSIEISQTNGPWVVMCASFVGAGGLEQAKALVQELRDEFKLNAYLHVKTFDYSNRITGIGWEKYQREDGTEAIRTPRMKAAHAESFDEYAVLVGDFNSPEDGKAQRALEKIKHIKPKSIHVSPTVGTNQRMGVLRAIQQQVTNDQAIKEMGPMRQAFIIPNPTLPEDYFNQQGPDPFVMKMNRNVRFGLLKCPKPYTVKVATFRGKTTFNQREMEAEKQTMQFHLRNKKPIKSDLDDAMNKANLLTKELRKAGFEAYEFHDRTESYVCVGSFDWATRKLTNGKDELNPEVAEVIKKFKARVDQIPGMQTAVRPKSMPSLKGKGITFDIQPLPVMVPSKPSGGLFSQYR